MKTLTEYMSIASFNEFREHLRLSKELSDAMLLDWLVSESHGSYKNHIDLARYLATVCDEMIADNGLDAFTDSKKSSLLFSKDELDSLNYSNVFFNKLYVKPTLDCSKYAAHGDWDSDNKIFEYVVLYVQVNKLRRVSNYNRLFIELAHELLHCYGDYCTYLYKKQKHLSDYTNSEDEIPTKYASIIDKFILSNETEELCKKILYSLIKTEQNSHISEINTIDFSKFKDHNDLFEKLQYNTIFTKYSNLLIELNDLQDTKTFIETYNKLSKTNKTWDYIYKKLNRQLNDANNKLMKYTYMSYIEYCEEVNNKSAKEAGLTDISMSRNYVSHKDAILENKYSFDKFIYYTGYFR